MKKTYIAPDMKVINVENNIIATSNPGYGTTGVDAGSALIRGWDRFDDEF